jgi:hypothetical protein
MRTVTIVASPRVDAEGRRAAPNTEGPVRTHRPLGHVGMARPAQDAGVPASGVAHPVRSTGDADGVEPGRPSPVVNGVAAGEATGVAQPAAWAPTSASSFVSPWAPATAAPLPTTSANARTIMRRRITNLPFLQHANPHGGSSRTATGSQPSGRQPKQERCPAASPAPHTSTCRPAIGSLQKTDLTGYSPVPSARRSSSVYRSNRPTRMSPWHA